MLGTLNDIDLSLLNFESKCRGKWTRVSYEKEKKEYILDFVIVEKSYSDFIKEVTIDEEKVYCPFRITGKSKKLVYSDHNAFLIIYDIDSDVKDYPKIQASCMNSWKVTEDGLLR